MHLITKSSGWRGILPHMGGSEMALRLASGAVGVPVGIAVILIGGELFLALTAAILVIAVGEFATGLGLPLRAALLPAAGVAAMVGAASIDDIPPEWPLSAAALAVLALPVFEELIIARRGGFGPPLVAHQRPIFMGLVALLYIGWLGTFFARVRELPQGEEWLLLAVFSVMATDTGAFVTGNLLGRHKLVPRISPRKTVEGAIGGMVGGFTAVVLINLLPDLDVTYWKIVILGIALPVIAQTGDLAESTIKRALDIKDFGRTIPGHGGVLDRLDSLLFGMPAVYFFVRWTVL